jgi:hypothetical protein
MGGFKALWPWLNGLDEQTLMASHRLHDPNLAKITDLKWNGESDDVAWLSRIRPQLVITDTIDLRRVNLAYSGLNLWSVSRKLNIPVWAYVDSWWCFEERFKSPDAASFNHTPDIIAAPDQFAAQGLINATLPSVKVLGSPHFQWLANLKSPKVRLDLLADQNEIMVVFVSQPLETFLGNTWGFTEKTVLTSVFDGLERLPVYLKKRVKLVLVPHPEEDEKELAQTAEKFPLSWTIQKEDRDYSLTRSADLIIGMFSILLTEAVILGRPVLCLQPGLKKEDMLITNMVGATVPVRV